MRDSGFATVDSERSRVDELRRRLRAIGTDVAEGDGTGITPLLTTSAVERGGSIDESEEDDDDDDVDEEEDDDDDVKDEGKGGLMFALALPLLPPPERTVLGADAPSDGGWELDVASDTAPIDTDTAVDALLAPDDPKSFGDFGDTVPQLTGVWFPTGECVASAAVVVAVVDTLRGACGFRTGGDRSFVTCTDALVDALVAGALTGLEFFSATGGDAAPRWDFGGETAAATVLAPVLAGSTAVADLFPVFA